MVNQYKTITQAVENIQVTTKTIHKPHKNDDDDNGDDHDDDDDDDDVCRRSKYDADGDDRYDDDDDDVL